MKWGLNIEVHVSLLREGIFIRHLDIAGHSAAIGVYGLTQEQFRIKAGPGGWGFQTVLPVLVKACLIAYKRLRLYASSV